jgi:hypothetical protein
MDSRVRQAGALLALLMKQKEELKVRAALLTILALNT